MENSAKPVGGLFSRKPRRDMLALSPTTNTLLNILMVVCCILVLFPIYVIVISSVTSAVRNSAVVSAVTVALRSR